jgi:hypothetical protein
VILLRSARSPDTLIIELLIYCAPVDVCIEVGALNSSRLEIQFTVIAATVAVYCFNAHAIKTGGPKTLRNFIYKKRAAA